MNNWWYYLYPVHNFQGKSKIIILPLLMESKLFGLMTHLLFFQFLTMTYLCSCPVAHYLDDWIQMGLLFPCSSRKMDDAIFNFYTIPKVRAKSSSCLYWWRVQSRQIVDKLHWLITHFIVLQITDNDLMVLMPSRALPRRLNSDGTTLSV
jgi:hypothetical protein